MKKHRSRIAAVLFFIVSAAVIAGIGSVHRFVPSQQVQLSHGVKYGAVVKGFLFVQEITLKKRYLSRIDLYMAKLPRTYPNRNVFLLADDQHRILYTKPFSSEDFGEALYFPFSFGKQLDIGRGRRVYACIYSLDGDQGSYIGLARKDGSNLGKLYVMNIVNDDVVRSLEEKQGLVTFEGSIGARTFESDTKFFSLLQIVLYLLAAALSLLIFFHKRILSFVKRSTVVPEHAFLGFALVSGLIILAVTPPFMVPDEPAHFYRAYQVSELNILKMDGSIPSSLEELGSICNRMQFSTHEKTTPREILSLDSIRTNPALTVTRGTPDYTIAYLPQAAGIAAGRLMGLSPLWLFYLGRLFNLLATVALLFLAIRITPVFKWVFFLLSVMPMTVALMASISYDAFTIGISFLFLAVILRHALGNDTPVKRREIAVLILLAALLAAAKQPYILLIATFLVIPAAKFRSRVQYLGVFAGVAAVAALVSMAWVPLRMVFPVPAGQEGSTTVGVYPPSAGPEEVVTRHPLTASMLPLVLHSDGAAGTGREGQAASIQQEDQPQPEDASQTTVQEPVNPVDPGSQIRFILHNPLKYTGILLNTVGHSRELYLTSFVGLFGWIDTPLPPVIAYGYLVLLLLFSLADAGRGKIPGAKSKLIFALVFIATFALIETALYIYCNPVGCDPVTAVQGRYFIAIGPLLFLLFNNRTVPERFRRLLDRRPKLHQGKKLPRQEKNAVPETGFPFEKALPWIAMITAFFSLAVSVIVLLERFYVITL